MTNYSDDKRDRALMIQIEENLSLTGARDLGPPPARLVALAEELARVLAQRLPKE